MMRKLFPVSDPETIEYLACHPEKLLSLSRCQFADLVAKLLHRQGYSVELRSLQTNVIACRNPDTREKYLIECRRYCLRRKVGSGDIRELLDKTIRQRARKGILITTSHFAKPAERLIIQHSRLIEGRDYDDLVQWIREISGVDSAKRHLA